MVFALVILLICLGTRYLRFQRLNIIMHDGSMSLVPIESILDHSLAPLSTRLVASGTHNAGFKTLKALPGLQTHIAA